MAEVTARGGLELMQHVLQVAAVTVALDHGFRVVVSLVGDPGTIVTDDDVRAYVEDFVVPALVHRAGGLASR